MSGRAILHVDCDCYYAALEMRDAPELMGKPVAVGGRGPRSVLTTCNYEAREFGVHSAMPTRQALNLCPDLIILPPRFDVYRETSEQIRTIFRRYANRIEPLSLDEAFLDISETPWFAENREMLAEHIRAEVFQTVGITVSAGLAPNKFLAKIASDWNKPNGLFVIEPEQVQPFLESLPLRKINGVGKKLAERLARHELHTCGDVRRWPLPRLLNHFGKTGLWLHQRALGIDDRPVGGDHDRKSLSLEHTFGKDLGSQDQCQSALVPLFEKMQARLNKQKGLHIKSIFVKVRFHDFKTTTMERGWALNFQSYQRLLQAACRAQNSPVRLIGMGVRFDTHISDAQLSLWPEESGQLGL